MAETAAPKRKVTEHEKRAKLQMLKDQERLNSIHYDDNLAKMENAHLKEELKYLRGIKRHQQLLQKFGNSKPKQIHKSMSHSMMNSKLHNSSHLGASNLSRHHSPEMVPPAMPLGRMETMASETLPIIKRKGTGYHKRFVQEVRPRDYNLYLNSLNAMKEYRHAEYQNKHIKDQIFKEKYGMKMKDYRSDSKVFWQHIKELGPGPVSTKKEGDITKSHAFEAPKEAKKTVPSKEDTKTANPKEETKPAPAKEEKKPEAAPKPAPQQPEKKPAQKPEEKPKHEEF